MRRQNAFQLTSQPWFPVGLTLLVHEFLVWFVGRVHAARPFVPVLVEALAHARARTIVDVQTGAGSGAATVLPELPEDIVVVRRQHEDLRADTPGVYAVINGLHRLSPEQAEQLIREVTCAGQPLVVVEGNNDNWWQAVGMLLFAPLSALLSAPFVRPLRASRLVFTYLIPILPLLIAFDGMAALFKLYPPADLDELFARVGARGYVWRTGKAPNGRGGKIIYGIGYPGRSPS